MKEESLQRSPLTVCGQKAEDEVQDLTELLNFIDNQMLNQSRAVMPKAGPSWKKPRIIRHGVGTLG